jgi:hypothetical protein
MPVSITSKRTQEPWHSAHVTRRQPPKPAPDPDNVIALARYRERLARGRGSRRADALFASPDPASAIRALPGDEFFYVIHELGFPEALDVLVHGTAEQVQTVLDFSIWERDRVDLEKSDDWLLALVEAPPAALGQWATGIDVELLALLLRQRARIYDLSLEEAPEEPEGELWLSPDRLFAIELGGGPDRTRVTQRLLDNLYRYSPGLMRRLLVGVRSESDAELEEAAFRWRSGRMADLGFVDFHEALAVYQEIDPASVRASEAPLPSPRPRGEPAEDAFLRLPAVVTERLAGKTAFARAVAGLRNREEIADLHFALVALANRVLSADRVPPGDDEAVRAVLERMSATLDLAIEFLARGNVEREVAAVRGVPLVTLHRLGVSLTGKLRRLALALVRKNPFAALRPAIDIFELEDREVLSALASLRPRFPRALETPPAPGERPFATLADLATATRAVERAAAALELIAGLGIRPAQLSPEALAAMAAGTGPTPVAIDTAAIDTGSLARTVLVARLLGDPNAPLAALSFEAVSDFKRRFNSGAQLSENDELFVKSVLGDAAGGAALEGARGEVAARWIASLCPLGAVLGANRPTAP